MKDLQKSIQQFPSDLKALDQVLSWFDQLTHPPIPTIVWLQCKLVIAEAFTNAVRHAHKNLPTSVPIEIEVSLLSHCLEMRIWDGGPPFDLEARLQAPSLLPDAQASGGRGLAIMQKIADKLTYRRTDDNRNCLLIVKFY